MAEDLERLRRLALEGGDPEAARALLQLASRRADRSLVGELRRSVPELRWPGCTYLRHNPFGAREFLHRRSGLVLVEIPAGETPAFEREDDRPSRHLSAFLIGRTTVPQAVFWRFAERHAHVLTPAMPGHRPLGWRTRRPQAAELCSPVHTVSWSQARDFCAWLGLALPTVDQWRRAELGAATTAPPPRPLDATLASHPLWQPDPLALDDARAASLASLFGVLALGCGYNEWIDHREPDGTPAPRAIVALAPATRHGVLHGLADRGASWISFRVVLDSPDPTALDDDEADATEARTFMLRIESELAALRVRLRPRPLGLDAIAPMRAAASARLALVDALEPVLSGLEDWRTRLEAGGVRLAFEPRDALDALATDARPALLADLAHLDPLALGWHVPRDERGRVELDQSIVLACYDGATRLRGGDAMALLATTPKRRRDAQLITLSVERVRPGDRAERWDLERYRWDARAAATALAERWGIAALPLAQLGAEARESSLERFAALQQRGALDEAGRAALAILLQDAGRLEEALAVHGVELDADVVSLLRGDAVVRHPLELREAWTQHGQLAVQRMALWRLHALAARSVDGVLTLLPHQTTARKTALVLRRGAHGARLELETTGTNVRQPRNLWLRPLELELVRFGLIESVFPAPPAA